MLDRDNVTGFVVGVEKATERTITISASSPGVPARYTYAAATGRLLAYAQEANMGVGIQYTELEAQ